MTIETETIMTSLAALAGVLAAGYYWAKARLSAKELNMLVDAARDATSQASDGGSSVTDSEALGMIGKTIYSLTSIERTP